MPHAKLCRCWNWKLLLLSKFGRELPARFCSAKYILYIYLVKKNASFVAGQLCSSERTSTGLSGPDYGKRRSIGVLNFEQGACKATDAAELCPADMNCISCAPETKPSGRVSVLVGVPAGQKSEDCFDSGTKI